ncbi:MAG TPA: S1 RNA-binding domain-containing protein [Candidatus Cryosericum sp.]|jgi:S1 RNA binding domain protein|nr:S1 RNA-binding domain-containing protein [Candidatus Cryosericum sp.]
MAEEHRIKLSEGVVIKIVPFGAFVKIDTNEVGLVHISEISDTYVRDVNQFLKEGDKVTVRIIGRNKDGKLNLSIKAAKAAGATAAGSTAAGTDAGAAPRASAAPASTGPRPSSGRPYREKPVLSPFDMMMKRYLQDSQEWQVDKKKRIERKRG